MRQSQQMSSAFSSAEMFKKPLWQTVWTQIMYICTGSTMFASLLNSSVMLGNYLQQTTSADDIFRCIFFGALMVKPCPANILILKMSSAFNICCIHSYALHDVFVRETNTANPDQTAPKGAV